MPHHRQPLYKKVLNRETLDQLKELNSKPVPAGPQHFGPPFNGFYATGEGDADGNDIAFLHLIDRQGQHESPAHADIFKRSGKGIIVQGKNDITMVSFAFVPPPEFTGLHLGALPF